MLKDKLKEKNQVQIDWSRYVDEDEAEEKGGFDTSSFGPGAMVRAPGGLLDEFLSVMPCALDCRTLVVAATMMAAWVSIASRRGRRLRGATLAWPPLQAAWAA